MKSNLPIIFVLLIAGCTTTQNINNSPIYPVSCSGFKGWDHCYSQAKVNCKNGFNVINSTEDVVAQSRNMTYQCK